MSAPQPAPSNAKPAFSNAELGALAHLYRGEVYRSTIWRTRLDTTTNWSVVTLGIAVSVSFSARDASPVPLLLVGLLVLFFLLLEARRYRYFNVWRARARWMENHFYAPMLERDGFDEKLADQSWCTTLARDYHEPHYHISFIRAVGRRLRRSYLWILAIQATAYVSKLAVHPEPASSPADIVDRAAIGPVSGNVVLFAGVTYLAALGMIALVTYILDRAKHGARPPGSMG